MSDDETLGAQSVYLRPLPKRASDRLYENDVRNLGDALMYFRAMCQAGVREFEGYAEAERAEPVYLDSTRSKFAIAGYLQSAGTMRAGVEAAAIALSVWQQALGVFRTPENQEVSLTTEDEAAWVYARLEQERGKQYDLGHSAVAEWLESIRDCYKSEDYSDLAI